MINPSDVWVVVPAYNESAVIASVLERLVTGGYQVVLVDDGSSDDTLRRVRLLPVHRLSHCMNLGAGAAVQTGIQYAVQHRARYVVTFDADGQHQSEDIPKLIEPLEAGAFDVALGSRFLGDGTAIDMPWAKRWLLRCATVYTRLFGRLDVSDTHNGLKAFTLTAAQKLNLTQNRFAHCSQMLAQIRTHRLRYTEVPVRVLYTPYSMQKGQRMSNAFNIVWDSLLELLHR